MRGDLWTLKKSQTHQNPLQNVWGLTVKLQVELALRAVDGILITYQSFTIAPSHA